MCVRLIFFLLKTLPPKLADLRIKIDLQKREKKTQSRQVAKNTNTVDICYATIQSIKYVQLISSQFQMLYVASVFKNISYYNLDQVS